ncbi:RxLR effector protein [Phytophthora megakarya]|uniref:RxLR effector protein n=1 Tax=Phytophthora megakarya TaxID=4795 RepID=A0A225W1D0_9STRA|nr:RxLR effector protein [Phytophthora megakarya]
MRFQAWLLAALLISLCTLLPTVLAVEVNGNAKFPDSTATKTLPDSKRFLRVTTSTVEMSQPDILESNDEERAITLSSAASKVNLWVHKGLYQGIKLVAGQRAADKISMKIADHVYFPLLYRMKTTPEYFLERASQEIDPIIKMNNEKAAKLFSAWIAKYHSH